MKENLITINEKVVRFVTGETILDVAVRQGIDIPTLCYLKYAMPTGACRICLVEVKGARTLLPSCSTEASTGMIVETESPKVVKARRTVIELMLADGCRNKRIRSRCEANRMVPIFSYLIRTRTMPTQTRLDTL